MTNLKVSTGQINQQDDYNFVGQLQKNGVNVTVISDSFVVPISGGGLLTANRINEITDGNTGYLLPLAASVPANSVITITLNVIGVTPRIDANGIDTITRLGVIDTSIVFDAPTTIQLASNGVTNWRFV